MSKETRHFYEFGPYRIDTRNRQLLRENEVVPLKAKAVETLLVLIGSRGDVVEKNELMQRLWPDSFVEEANLTQNIYTLRKALGEEYIQTVPRRGYRFAPILRIALSVEIVGKDAQVENIHAVVAVEVGSRIPAGRGGLQKT